MASNPGIGRGLAAVAALAWLLAGCAIRPNLDQAKADVAKLAQVLPQFANLQVTDFERNRCQIVAYVRGAFAGADQSCTRLESQPFDEQGVEDYGALVAALEAVDVAVDRMFATYAADGRLVVAHFVHREESIVENWEYVYDPDRVEPKRVPNTSVEFLQLNDSWWFVVTPDD